MLKYAILIKYSGPQAKKEKKRNHNLRERLAQQMKGFNEGRRYEILVIILDVILADQNQV